VPAQRLTFASLFSGCGGFDLGFVQEGYVCVAAFDNDPLAVGVYAQNVGKAISKQDLAAQFDARSKIGKVDVLIAGPPCQGFSTAGKRDPKDPRNELLLVAGKIAARVKPRVVVIENVIGVVAGQQRRFWDSLNAVLRSNGYQTAEITFDASKMGVAQTRRRKLLFAWNTGAVLDISLPSVPSRVLRDVLISKGHNNDHDPQVLTPGTDAARIASRIRPNQKLCNVRAGIRSVHTWEIPEVFGVTTSYERSLLESIIRIRRRDRIRNFGDADPVTERAIRQMLGRPVAADLKNLVLKGFIRRIGNRYDLVHTFNGKFRRLAWDLPAPTVDTRFGQPRYFLHPEENRGFSAREAARIQGFPDSFIFDGAVTEQFRLIGNAVPPPVARSIARYIDKALLS
jgi:DNA (cytosine-5)-methyltransferase 1